MEKWPNFFIVGAAKAGTTSLYNYLQQVPEVYMSPTKEPRYFTRTKDEYFDIPMNYDKKKYLKLFDGVKDEIAIGEATARYLNDPESAKFIHKVVPDARILISLRDPVEKAFSFYLMLSQSFETRSFHDVIHCEKSSKKYSLTKLYLDSSMYCKQVERYLQTFGKDNVKVLIFEEWINNPVESINDVLKFLGVNNNVKSLVREKYNPFRGARGTSSKFLMSNPIIRKIIFNLVPFQGKVLLKKIVTKKEKKPKLSNEDRCFLEKFYKEDVKNLEILLGRKLPWTTAAS